MPVRFDERTTLQLDVAIPAEESQVEVDHSFYDTAKAALSLENTVGSLLSRESGLPNNIINDRDFNPFSQMTEAEQLDTTFVSNASLADNMDELNAVRAQSANERKNRKVLSEAGAMGVLTSIGAAVFDPVNLIPVGGTAYKSYKTGHSILAGAIATGSVAAGSTALAESALHAAQLERTFSESAINMGGALLLGGVLGGGIGALNSKALRDIEAQIADSMNVEPKIKDRVDSVGSARVSENVQIQGKVARVLSKVLAFDPLTRSLTARSQIARDLAATLAENPYAMDGETGTAVESLIKTYDGYYVAAFDKHIKAYEEFQKELGGNTGMQRILNRKGMSRTEFNEAVAKELRNPKPETPAQIKQAAQSWKQNFYDPIKQNAIDVGIFGDDVAVTTAENYVNRMWQGPKIAAEKPKFVDTVAKWLADNDEKLFAKADDMDAELKAINKEIDQLKGKGGKATTKFSPEVINTDSGFTIKTKNGSIQGEAVGDSFRINLSKVDEGSRGKGEGVELYLNAIQEAKARGFKTVLSDNGTVDAGAIRVYESLERRGVKVDKHPDYKLVKDPKGDFAHAGDNSPYSINLKSLSTKATKEQLARINKLEEMLDPARRKAALDLDELDYRATAEEIANRIIGSPDGVLPYDWQIGGGSKSQPTFRGANDNLKGPLKSRVFNIPDELVEDFLENDIEALGGSLLRSVAPDIELTRAFGDVDMKQQLKEIETSYSDMVRDAKTPKERKKLNAEYKTAIRDIAAMRDRMRNIFGKEDPNAAWPRVWRAVRDLNYMRFMGGVVASSITDVARIFMAEGFANTFSKGLLPLISNIKAFKVSAAEGRAYGVGTDMIINGRSEILADVADYTQGTTALERGLRAGARGFSSINLMNQWTTGVKQLHAVVMQNRIIPQLKSGKIDKQVASKLKRLGLNADDQRLIGEQLKKHGTVVEGQNLANPKKWDDQALERIWGAAIRKESDRVIVVPGQEKPLFMSSELGKTFMQFRSFMFASTQRMLIAGMQGQEANYFGGMTMMIGLGSMSYAFKQWDAGREISDDPKVWVTEGIDRSGALGMLGEINNTVEKISGNSVGMRPLLGVSEPASRFASRSQAEAMLGPTFGSFLSTTLRVANSAADTNEWQDSDTRALRRLLPYQNLSFLRQGFDKIEESLKE